MVTSSVQRRDALERLTRVRFYLRLGRSLGAAPPARQVLGVEEGASVVALLAMGYPAEVPPAPPRDSVTVHLREGS